MRYLPCLAVALLAGCDTMPVRVPNDTSQTVRIDIHGRDFPTPIQLEGLYPSLDFGTRHCWEKSDSILLATKEYPDPIVLAPKDFCNPRLCDCDIPVSKLLKQMTPRFVLKRQQAVCAGGGPFLRSDVRVQLCVAYVARAMGKSLSSGTDPAMLAP